MFGFQGKTPGKAIKRFIEEFHIGGVIYFSRNLQSAAQTAKLSNAIQVLSPKMPLFIGIDQEGGRVSRLPKDFTIFPSNARVASRHSTPLVYRVAEITAKELRAVGVNLNFAPVLDINTNAKNTVIGDRAFGSDHETVSTMGLTALAGYQDNHVVACGKHFPGHGDTSADSHKELPVVEQNLQRLGDVEIRPFVHAIENGLASIMTAHVMYPQVDPENPATLSPKFIKGILRNQFRYKGIVVTDDMEMKAITDKYEMGEAAVRAIEAGADVILVCSKEDAQLAAIEAVTKAVKEKRISEARIEQSLLRILQVKEKYLMPYQRCELAHVKEVVGCGSHQRFLETLLEKTKGAALGKA